MKISATDTQQIDRYLLQQLPPGDKLLFDVQLVLCPQLQENLDCQQKVHQLVKLRGRQQLKAQIKSVEQMLFIQPVHVSFRQRVFKMFR
jgi:hypothetical protein